MYICMISSLFLPYIVVPFMWKKALKGIPDKFRPLRYCQNVVQWHIMFRQTTCL